MKRVVLAAALLGATALPAFAGITCNMTDQRGNTLTYSFGRGGDGIAPEIAVSRNGTILSTGGPSWTRVSDKAQKSNTLWQDEWSIAYPWDGAKGVSVLRHRDNIVARGACIADYTVDTPVVASAPVYNPPTYSAPAAPPSYGGAFSVPIANTGSRAYVAVNLGGAQTATMLIDTGCTDMTVTQSIADAMLQRGDAETLSPMNVTYADGSIHSVQQILIHRIEIGGHTLSNVSAGVSPNSADMLLGFPILNKLGKFTIDTQNNQLVFG
jgi:clan AA aspartic protease (TIGR02281 family)